MTGNTASKTKCAILDRNNEIKMRRELLIEILDSIPDQPIFEKVLDFYRKIFLQKPDLIVCMSRKSWCVINMFLPLLENEGIVADKKKLTHDRMVHPWFAELEQNKRGQVKVFVIDDTFQTGRALDECVRRLKFAYNVDEKNLTVAVFAIIDDARNQQRIDIEKKLYTVYRSPSRNKPLFEVNWGGENAFYTKEDVLRFSCLFVEALYACSEPYVGYIPAFRLPIEVVEKFLGTNRGKNIECGSTSELDNASVINIPGYLEQDDLRAPLNDPAIVGYYNITSQQMQQHDVEAFYFSLPALDSSDKNYLPFLPPNHALSIAALRFYLNRKTGIALIVPYLSLKDCRAEADIVKMFPKELQPLMREMCSKQEWSEDEGLLAAYRLLRYAAGYLWGKYAVKQWFRRDVKEEDIASFGGICSEIFFAWLNGSSAVQDLTHIWSFFSPEMNVVV
ncbi:MAG: phosphoribosyltransferase [Holosporaceae bacterium]|nr:phosphoribosyltransferase [Holosporaceae bacterium]